MINLIESVYSTTHNMFWSDALRCTQLLSSTHLCHKSPLLSIAEGCQSECNAMEEEHQNLENCMGCTVASYMWLGRIKVELYIWWKAKVRQMHNHYHSLAVTFKSHFSVVIKTVLYLHYAMKCQEMVLSFLYLLGLHS